MSMIKTFRPSSWDIALDIPTVATVKIASTGLRGADRQDFIKRAGANAPAFLAAIDHIKIAHDEHPVHVIGLGAWEAWGHNRNGDAFREKACQDYHHTFVKYAKFYRNHQNKRPEISYGKIAASGYNPEMRRVELLIGLNKTKEAAERNGGLIADRELQKLASGKDLAVSMACLIPYDTCDACGNNAKTREDYCKAASCPGGGCAENLTKMYKSGSDIRATFVHNDHPKFFDMTNVESDRPADRIAYGNTATWIDKQAAVNDLWEVGGLKLAEALDLTAPLEVILASRQESTDPVREATVKIAYGLDCLEENPGLTEHQLRGHAVRLPVGFNNGVDNEKQASNLLAAFADRLIVLTLPDYAELTKRAEFAEPARALLPGIYSRMLNDDSIDAAIDACRYSPARGVASERDKLAAVQLAPLFSLSKEAVDTRAYSTIFEGRPVPTLKSDFGIKSAAAYCGQAGKLARDYAIYKAASLARIIANGANPSALLTSRLVACHDRVI